MLCLAFFYKLPSKCFSLQEIQLLLCTVDGLTNGTTFSLADVISCEVAGCLRMTACERKTEVCQCTTHSGVIPCSLKPPKPSTGEGMCFHQKTGKYDSFRPKLKFYLFPDPLPD